MDETAVDLTAEVHRNPEIIVHLRLRVGNGFVSSAVYFRLQSRIFRPKGDDGDLNSSCDGKFTWSVVAHVNGQLHSWPVLEACGLEEHSLESFA